MLMQKLVMIKHEKVEPADRSVLYAKDMLQHWIRRERGKHGWVKFMT